MFCQILPRFSNFYRALWSFAELNWTLLIFIEIFRALSSFSIHKKVLWGAPRNSEFFKKGLLCNFGIGFWYQIDTSLSTKLNYQIMLMKGHLMKHAKFWRSDQEDYSGDLNVSTDQIQKKTISKKYRYITYKVYCLFWLNCFDLILLE